MDEPRTGRGERRFTNGGARAAGAAFGGLLAVLGLAGLVTSDWSGVVYVLVGGVFAFRALSSSALIVSSSSIQLRGFARTRRIQLDDVSGAEVAVGRTGMNGFGREYPLMHRRDGATCMFKELNAKPTPNRSTVVQEAAGAINDAVRSRGDVQPHA